MKKPVLLFSLLLLLVSASAQKESWNWYFGENAGIGFSSGSPVLQSGSLNTYEGVASISDTNGLLLFYTDGSFVYDDTHAQMPNGFGLLGHPSSTQSSIIIRLPGSYTIYYIFTVDYNWNGTGTGNGFCYSIVDMSLNGGLGDVTIKNVQVRLPVYEKLTAVKHGNNTDYWILINDWQSDDIYAYLFTATGLNTAPVASNAGPFHNMYAGNTAGYFKASRQGNKLVLALWDKQSFDLCDFDNLTGIAYNHLVVQSPDMVYTYGAEFSPNGHFLYGTNMNPPCHLYQFDVTFATAADILASRVTLDSSNILYYYSALQLAPDGKIYCAHRNVYYLGTIDYPDSIGHSCSYTDNSFSTGSHLSRLGLPNYPADYIFVPVPGVIASAQSSDTIICQETCIDFTDLSSNSPTSWQWYFPGAGPPSSTDQNPSNICYAIPGNYDVTLIAGNSNGSDTLVLAIFITVSLPPPDPVITISNDTLFCNIASDYAAFQWYNNGSIISGATDSVYYATANGDYTVEVFDTAGCRTVSDPFIFTLISEPEDESVSITVEQNFISIYLSNPGNEIAICTLLNGIGETIIEKRFISENNNRISIQDLAPGIYLLSLKTKAKNLTGKFIIE